MTDSAGETPTPDAAPAAASTDRRASVGLYLLLWIATVVASAAQTKVAEELLGDAWRAQASFFVLVTASLGSALVLDGLLFGPWKRALLAGVASVACLFTVASALFLSITSIPLAAGLAQLNPGVAAFDTLREAELGSMASGFATLLPVCFVGGALLSRLPRTALRPRLTRGALAALALLWVSFVVEQAHARRSSSTYFMRAFILPVYWQLFEVQDEPEVIPIAPPRDKAAREQVLSRIGPARNPKHVLIVGLESVRPDVIRPDVSPHLARLRAESLDFTNAYSVTIYTALSWVTILLDRPAVSALTDLLVREPSGDSAWPLAVLAAAGYRSHLAFSGNLIWGKDTERRITGDTGSDVQHLVHHPDKQALQRHLADDEVTAQMVRWIEEADPRSPQLFLLQLDSTHWNYHFHPERVVEQDYPDAVDPRALTTQAELDAVRRRYLNAVHHVDDKVGEVLAALERKGMLADTAVAVFSDHGEGFAVGRAGHMALSSDNQRIPFFLRLPGQPPRQDPRLVDQRRLWPLLADYLQLEGVTRDTFQTSSSWSGSAVFSCGLHLGDLVLNDQIVRFRIKRTDGAVSLYPIASVDENGALHGDPEALLRTLPWRETIRELIQGR